MMTLKHDSEKKPQGGGCVGFGFGIFLGIFIAISVWIEWYSIMPIWLVPAIPVVVGIIGAKYGDHFWNWLLGRRYLF
jgi:hypothetical protein